MDFTLSKQQEEIRDKAREFATTRLAENILVRDETREFPRDLFDEMGKMGLIGLPYPKEFGGSGMDYLSYILALVEISKVDASMGISYSVCTSLYCATFDNAGCSDTIKEKYMKPVASGKSLGAFCLTEPKAGSDAGGCKTTAVKVGKEYLLNGSKCFITNGPIADYFIVFALTDPELGTKSMAGFILEKGMPGFTVGNRHNTMGIRSAEVSELHFENCRVPEENMIAPPGEGFHLAMKNLDGGRIGVAAQALGIAEGAFEIARSYLQERTQFGRPLSRQQYLAFDIADLYVTMEEAQWMLYKATLDKMNHDPNLSLSAAKAKLVCTNAAMKVTTEAVQLLGGNGYMKEYHVERMMRDAKITQIYEGTNEIQKLILSKALLPKKTTA